MFPLTVKRVPFGKHGGQFICDLIRLAACPNPTNDVGAGRHLAAVFDLGSLGSCPAEQLGKLLPRQPGSPAQTVQTVGNAAGLGQPVP